MSTPDTLTSADAVQIVLDETPATIEAMNRFSSTSLRTRGGRLGSGMGSLLEALWVYFINKALENEGGEAHQCEIAWLEDHEPNDFACVHRDAEWIPGTRVGELFRVEAKSMNIEVDESKGHFAELQKNMGDYDQLLVLTWKWEKVDEWRRYPMVVDFIFCHAKSVAELRDRLHEERGGSFVLSGSCPDGCVPQPCTHTGEPLNASNIRERITGPTARKGTNVSAANNFGGLVRMLKTDNEAARKTFRKIRKTTPAVHDFINFIHQNFDKEEANQYQAEEWEKVATEHGINIKRMNKGQIIEAVRATLPNYRAWMRDNL